MGHRVRNGGSASLELRRHMEAARRRADELEHQLAARGRELRTARSPSWSSRHGGGGGGGGVDRPKGRWGRWGQKCGRRMLGAQSRSAKLLEHISRMLTSEKRVEELAEAWGAQDR